MKLIDLLNHSNFDFYFLVVDSNLDINLPQLKNFHSITPQKFGIKLEIKNSGKLLSHPQVLDFIKNNSKTTGRKPVIIPFKPSAKIDLICQQNAWIVGGNPSTLNRFFEDKIKFYDLCIQNNLPVIPSLVLPFNQQNYKIAKEKYLSDLVLQTHFGWAGNSSYISSNWDDISNKISHDTIVKISPLLSGYSLINNCCLTSNGLIQSPPGLQYTGIKSLTNNPLATVGRQWPAFISSEIKTQIKLITTHFSEVLTQSNYQGFFGLDFFVTQDKVYLLECNPRLTASFAFYTQLELNKNLNPLFLLHLGQFIKLNIIEPDHFDSDIVGSEVTSKNSIGATIKKYQSYEVLVTDPKNIVIEDKIISKLS